MGLPRLFVCFLQEKQNVDHTEYKLRFICLLFHSETHARPPVRHCHSASAYLTNSSRVRTGLRLSSALVPKENTPQVPSGSGEKNS